MGVGFAISGDDRSVLPSEVSEKNIGRTADGTRHAVTSGVRNTTVSGKVSGAIPRPSPRASVRRNFMLIGLPASRLGRAAFRIAVRLVDGRKCYSIGSTIKQDRGF